jgi:hypothetical protein
MPKRSPSFPSSVWCSRRPPPPHHAAMASVAAATQAPGQACGPLCEVGPARPWAARTLHRPRSSRVELGHTRVAQAGCAGTVQLGRNGFGPVTVELFFFYFPNIFKSLQI